MNQKVIVSVTPDGEVKVSAAGLGAGCKGATKAVEDALGVVTHDERVVDAGTTVVQSAKVANNGGK